MIDEHRAVVAGEREPWSAAIGCVPWLTHTGISERLAQLGSCCVVVNKGREWLPSALATADNGFPPVLPGLRSRAPAVDGRPVTLGPYSGQPEYAVGPVRTVGMTGGERTKPLLYAKLLVLGRPEFLVYDADGYEFEELTFHRARCGGAARTGHSSPARTSSWVRGPTTCSWRGRRRPSLTT